MADLVVDGLTVSLSSSAVAPAGGAASPANVVDDVSFVVPAGRAVALVGESGSGKTLTALALLRLLPDVATITGGRVLLRASSSPPSTTTTTTTTATMTATPSATTQTSSASSSAAAVDLLQLSERALNGIRGKRVAMVFQEPMTALNPLLRVDDQAGEALRVHQGLSKRAARRAAAELLQRLGVPLERASAHPHELSGGQRQRVMLATALSASPEVLIADEPTTALDVTVQAKILELLREEQRARGLGLLLITHDLGVVAQVCDDVVVMYAGKVVEQGSVADVFADPKHPYTRALLASIPARAEPGKPLPQIRGQVPPVAKWPTGCRFRDRCDLAIEACAAEPPVVIRGQQRVRCVRA